MQVQVSNQEECLRGCANYAGARAPCLFVTWGNGRCIYKNGKTSIHTCTCWTSSCMSVYSLSLTHSLTHSPTQSLTHSLTHPLTHRLNRSLTQRLNHSLTHSHPGRGCDSNGYCVQKSASCDPTSQYCSASLVTKAPGECSPPQSPPPPRARHTLTDLKTELMNEQSIKNL